MNHRRHLAMQWYVRFVTKRKPAWEQRHRSLGRTLAWTKCHGLSYPIVETG